MRSFCLFLSFVLIAFSVQAQKYIPFPTLKDSAVWRGSSYGQGRGPDTEYWIDGTTFIDYDTIINGKAYHHLKSEYWFITKDKSAYFNVDNNIGYIREENRKIFFYRSDKPEYVLYDFTLAVGDITSRNTATNYYYKITKIDSVLLHDSLYHKRFIYCGFKFNDTIADVINSYIEGIGGIESSRLAGQLKCFTSNNINIYRTVNQLYCGKLGAPNYNILVSAEDKIKKEVFFSIFPNPTTGQFTVQTQSIFGESYICVTDILGKIILQEKLQFPNQTINISNQPRGLYFVELYQNGNKSVEKVILE